MNLCDLWKTILVSFWKKLAKEQFEFIAQLVPNSNSSIWKAPLPIEVSHSGIRRSVQVLRKVQSQESDNFWNIDCIWGVAALFKDLDITKAVFKVNHLFYC